MSQKTVSIITPCYNGGKYIHRLLDSILMQTFPKVEMIIIDDGSTDDSAEIIKAYIPRFKKKGYSLEYKYQKNQGQSVAINRALKLVSGDYLVWPDADDYYASPKTISMMVQALEKSDKNTSMVRVEYNVLTTQGELLYDLSVTNESKFKTDLFEDAIFGSNGFWYPPGGIMAKMKKIDQLIPRREIYTERNAGQNFQLYLPLLYRQKCLTIEKHLYNIVAHDDSHSRNSATNNERQKIYHRTIKNTLLNMPLDKNYRSYLLKKTKNMTLNNSYVTTPRWQFRTYIKRTIKGLIPYGLMMLYKRRRF